MRGECHVGQGRYATYTVWDKCTLLHTRTSIHHCTLYGDDVADKTAHDEAAAMT